MKNKNIKKILLYISLIPYIILIFMCICYAVIGYGYNLGNTAYGFIAVGNFLGDVFSKIIKYLFFNPIALCIIILWIGYQIYYFISFKSNKKEKAEYSKESNVYTSKNINLKEILFFISILCWIIYFASGIFAFFFGSNTGGGLFNPKMEYGIDALLHTLLWNLTAFSLIPVLPSSLLYIIIYVIVKKKEEKNSSNINN